MTWQSDRLREPDAVAADAPPARTGDWPQTRTEWAGSAVDRSPHFATAPGGDCPTEAAGVRRPVQPMTFTYPAGSSPLPPYTIRRGIGIGGFGEVYFAVSEAGKEVALKRIQRNLDVELRGVSQCLNLKHPHLVSLFDICHDDQDQAWVVMEYMGGANLRQVLDDAPDGLPPAEVRRWFSAIASGVDHLHSAGLVHRDLKPGNVFDDRGIIKVGDYGLSKFISASHRSGHTESVGTFHYMAPEIGRGQYGRGIDLYAMGVLLHELLTGRVPFDGESCHEIIIKHLTAAPELAGIEPPYREVIAAALEKDPRRRPASAEEMLAALGWADSAPAAAPASAPQAGSNSNASTNAGDGASWRPEPGSRSGAPPEDERPVEAKLAGTSPAGSPAASPVDSRATSPPAAAAPNRSPQAATDPVADPVVRAVRDGAVDLRRWWAGLDRSPGAKAFLAIGAVTLLLMNTAWLLPLVTLAGVVYVGYYVVRLLALPSRPQPTYAEAQRMANVGRHPCRPVSRAQLRGQLRAALRAKPSLDRLAEWTASGLAAMLAVAVLLPIAALVGLGAESVDARALAPYVMVALLVLLTALTLLALGKVWERSEGEGLLRRLVLSGLGAALGLAAYALARFLMVPLEPGERSVDAGALPSLLYGSGGEVGAAALIVHFALLFGLLRWWKPVDPLRRARLSLWAVAVAVGAEWCLHQILPVPQPSGMLIAGGIAIATQLAAPWINPRRQAEPAARQPAAARAGVRGMA